MDDIKTGIQPRPGRAHRKFLQYDGYRIHSTDRSDPSTRCIWSLYTPPNALLHDVTQLDERARNQQVMRGYDR